MLFAFRFLLFNFNFFYFGAKMVLVFQRHLEEYYPVDRLVRCLKVDCKHRGKVGKITKHLSHQGPDMCIEVTFGDIDTQPAPTKFYFFIFYEGHFSPPAPQAARPRSVRRISNSRPLRAWCAIAQKLI